MDRSGGRAFLVGAGRCGPELLTPNAGRLVDEAVAHPGQPVLDWLDRRLLGAYQRDFPVCEKPFAEIASRLRCRANEVLRRLAVLERRGVVSRVGPVFASDRIGASTLAAMAVPRARLESVAEWVNRYRAVNRIYEREHELNLWFVLAAPNAGALYETLVDIRHRTGLDVLDLRLERDYHIDPGLPPWRPPPSDRCRAASGAFSPGRNPPLDASDRRLVGATREGLSLTARPYAVAADRAGLSEAQAMKRLRRLLCEGVIKRIDHREAACPSEFPTAWIRDSNVTPDGLRIGPWRSLEEGEPAGTADIDRRRWRDWTWGSLARLADDGRARTGARAMTGRDLLLGSSFSSAAGDSANPGARWSRRGQAAPTRLAGAHGTSGDGRIGLSGADCARGRLLPGVTLSESDRDGFEGPVRHWRTAIGTSLEPPGRERASWTAEEADGCTISLKWDAFGMRMASGAVSDTGIGNPVSADAGRVGLLPEGSRRFDNGPSRILSLSLEAGIPRDGGDARSVASVRMESASGSGTH